jgi:hypothetical protein
MRCRISEGCLESMHMYLHISRGEFVETGGAAFSISIFSSSNFINCFAF